MQHNIIYINQSKKEHLNSLDAECYILDTSLDEEFCREFINIATPKDKVVLFFGANNIEYAKKYGADGIICELEDKSLKQQMENLRKTLGSKKVIGLISRNRRHEAMLLSELEPDFIIFKLWKDGIEKTEELLEWYSDFFLIQSAIWPMDDVSPTTIKADFVIKNA